ncbi:DUF1302 domain-containing protein [Zestomonas carbonaria]|uniref:DUF1302 domain-containing protein n=1 Tax=Zestomonas carbonaria TaxID=2762745 RepID=A0A7U7ERT0_9GAMM|nr:DUF1302 domain-containing protein [Pseudomonas carbonaria]CAD5109905.1 hypothetical protein PSEWESI4_04221 [Pseudomonas carbonaria]
MTRRQPPWRQARLALAISLTTLSIQTASAVTFKVGDIEGQFDSTLSVGASWALRNPKQELLNGRSGDDGRRNFEQGKTFSKIFKGIHDLELKYGDTGIFLRGKYWYDFELRDEHREFKDIDDHNRKEGAKSAGRQLLDAFIYHNYLIGELPGTVRLGKQVVNWGESTFIPGGINAINPVDVAAFRRPGSEIKEGLIPVNMFYLSQNFTDNLSVEGFYQLEWDQTVVDNCGTFFSQTDVIADGCDGLRAGPALDQNPAAQAALSPFGIQLTNEGIKVPRSGDRDARDSGQWGMALRWFAPELNSEFAGYVINYHSRQPYFSTTTGPNATDLGFAPQLCANLGIPAPGCAGFLGSADGQGLVQAYRLGSANYFAAYPEDIRLYGLSFSTGLPTGTTLSGEISYRPNMPVQINPVDLVSSVVGIPAITPVVSSGAMAAANNLDLYGYRRKEVTQAQVTATHFFDQVMGADRLTLIGEAGVTYVGGLEGKGGLRYGRSTLYGQGRLYPDNSVCTTLTNAQAPQHCTDDGYVTSSSWGYRVRAIWEYSNLIPGVQINPSLAWSHDVKGYGPEPGFNEGSKAISLGIDATYLNTYSASLSYTDYFGGNYNVNVDRDFVALSFSVAF